MHIRQLLFAALVGAALLAIAVAGPPLAASEISATHRIFEKPVKMKRIDATLYLSYAEQTRRRDPVTRARRVECAVAAAGTRGELAVRGRLELRLVGRTKGADASWKSAAVRAELDEAARASFESSELEPLLTEARAARAEVELIEIGFAGGRGKRVTALAFDCLREPAAD